MPVPAGDTGGSTLPTWAPTGLQVAAYVPQRTIARDTASTIGSTDTYRFDWDTTTTPTSDVVEGLIADGCTWVTSRVYPLAVTSEPAAGVCAALFSAAMIERSWPNDDQALQRANDLEKRLDVLVADLVEANNVANGTGDYGIDLAVPYWSWPAADCRYDSAIYW